MLIRQATTADLPAINEIDGTIESTRYLHVLCTGQGLRASWSIEERPLRNKLIAGNPLDDETRFALKLVLSGADDGVALVAEHEGRVVAMAVARPNLQRSTLEIVDLRVDGDHRRQGIAMALIFQLIHEARTLGLRALAARTAGYNLPAGELMLKAGLQPAGVDTHFHSNHDLVKEAVTIFWYAALN